LVALRTTDGAAALSDIVRGGIASLAAAAFMIRDGKLPGHDITVLDELDKLGGNLDGSGSPRSGYVLRGGRMLESKYLCTYHRVAPIGSGSNAPGPGVAGRAVARAASAAWSRR
jgi:myosin-crossreactive antigen